MQIAINNIEKEQYDSIKKIAEFYYEMSGDYNGALIDLLNKLLRDEISFFMNYSIN